MSGTDPSCSILLAELNPLLREKIAGVLGRLERIWCVGQVGSSSALLRATATLRPDLVLADLGLLQPPEILPRLRELAPATQIIGLVDSVDDEHRRRARRLGLDGIWARSSLVEEVSQRLAQEA